MFKLVFNLRNNLLQDKLNSQTVSITHFGNGNEAKWFYLLELLFITHERIKNIQERLIKSAVIILMESNPALFNETLLHIEFYKQFIILELFECSRC